MALTPTSSRAPRRAVRAAAIVALALAGGCDGPAPADLDAGDASPDAADGPITGRIYTRALAGDYPDDLSALPVRALVPDASDPTGYRTIAGVGRADGTFTIDGVPPGATYLLAIGIDYYLTDQRTVERRIERLGRPDAPRVTGSSYITFDVGNLQPFQGDVAAAHDFITVRSFGAATVRVFDSAVFHNATRLAASPDWLRGTNTQGGGPALPTGDDLHVIHERVQPVALADGRSLQLRRTIDWFDAGAVTLPDGGEIMVTGAFVPVPLTHSLAFSVDRAAYDAAVDHATTSSPGGPRITLSAAPITAADGQGLALMSVWLNDWSRTGPLTAGASVTYGDAFPPSWSRTLIDSYGGFRVIEVPGAMLPAFFQVGTSRVRPWPANAQNLGPGLLAPTDFRVGGLAAGPGGHLPIDGQLPVAISWSPVVDATQYKLFIFRVTRAGISTRPQAIARLSTTATELAVPAEAFGDAEFVVFLLVASSAPNAYRAGELAVNGVPTAQTVVASGLFRRSATCGDGTPDPGEDCDTAGPSASCDVDCTAPMCGDGLANAAAGEACDTIADTHGCDGDCTLPVCGDGYLNEGLEDCDDGDAIDNGDGCTAACKFNNVCGDGVRQAEAEECDTGGASASCDADCTLADCGDGVTNSAAGEQCDLGLGNGDDPGCSDLCQLP